MSSIDSGRGRIALMIAHCAGMIDLVALSVWVSAIIASYQLDAQQAGSLPALFLAGAVVASVVLAPRTQRLSGRAVAAIGFGIAALAFWRAAGTTQFLPLAVLHGVAGLAAGAALSVAHGTIARSINPHRLFAIAGMALGVFAVVFLAAMPQLVAVRGGAVLFKAFALIMAIGGVAALLAFPTADPAAATTAPRGETRERLPGVIWFGIAGISCMTLIQSMIFSFLETAGLARGFERTAINGVLIALGLVNLLPAVLAALLQKRLSARKVMMAGPVAQVALAAGIMLSPSFALYAIGGVFLAAVMIFTHTFAFGLLAQMDKTGRALSGTPAMLMAGSAVGPFLGGTPVKAYGYGALAMVAAVLGAVAVLCFSRLKS